MGAVGSEAGEKAASRWTTNRLVGVGVGEGDALLGNAVDVRSFCEVVAVTAEVGFEVVDDDDEDVGAAGSRRRKSQEARGKS